MGETWLPKYSPGFRLCGLLRKPEKMADSPCRREDSYGVFSCEAAGRRRAGHAGLDMDDI